MTDHPLLRTVKPEHRFFLQDGASIAGLKELSKKLGTLPEATYKHHVNFAKNDFHSWVSHVIKDTHLSKDIKDVKDQKKMAMLVAKRVSELESRDSRREISQAVAQAQMAAAAISYKTESQPAPSTTPQNISKPGNTIKPEFERPSNTRMIPKAIPSEPGWVQLKALDHTPKAGRAKIPALGIKKPAVKKEALNEEISTASAKPTKTQSRRTRSNKRSSKTRISRSIERAWQETGIPPQHLAYTPHIAHLHTASNEHDSHKSCMRCGMMEFGIGLAVGIVATMMLARAFF